MDGAAQMIFVLMVQLNKFDILIVIAQSGLSITSWTDPVSGSSFNFKHDIWYHFILHESLSPPINVLPSKSC